MPSGRLVAMREEKGGRARQGSTYWVARFKETTLTNKGTVEGIDFYVRGLKHSSVPCPSRHQSHPYWITNDVLGSRGLAHHHLNISSTHHPSLPSTTPITSTYSGLSRRTEYIVVGRKPVDAQHRQGHHDVRPNFNHTPSRNGSPNVHPQHLGAPAVSLACQVPPPSPLSVSIFISVWRRDCGTSHANASTPEVLLLYAGCLTPIIQSTRVH